KSVTNARAAVESCQQRMNQTPARIRAALRAGESALQAMQRETRRQDFITAKLQQIQSLEAQSGLLLTLLQQANLADAAVSAQQSRAAIQAELSRSKNALADCRQALTC